MIPIDPKYKPILLEAIVEHMYRLSIELQNLKGGPLTKSRRELTKKQADLEALQHFITTYGAE